MPNASPARTPRWLHLTTSTITTFFPLAAVSVQSAEVALDGVARDEQIVPFFHRHNLLAQMLLRFRGLGDGPPSPIQPFRRDR